MTRLPRILCLIAGILATALSAAPPVSTPAGYIVDFTKYDFIDSTLNLIQFPSGKDSFEPFFQKMDTLVFETRARSTSCTSAVRTSRPTSSRAVSASTS